jgi:hypothetical protein
VNLLRIEENALRGRGFTGVYMRNNTYIACFFQWKFSRHDIYYQR